ncbi:protein LMBR1L-like [Lytechinus variegatus]|uniref:protein LMBR1L-like n=1 Tax=Lytechinus variegatus TaxID=7654 RepID=UPI001BB1D81A|nr:protein LMBR1L-like [Lytechinus variegatus]XP_041459264.1 protein LMBR1L-like [Lytechinus variegatus]
MEVEQQWDAREQIFHDAVREYLIDFLFFTILYLSSYAVICRYKRRTDKEDLYSADAEDAMVYSIALWLCTFTMAVSVGAVLLLPLSIISNEVLLWYPKSFYIQWLNGSLIHGLWNLIFLFSNLCLFVLLPFAYFFTESEGFPGSKKGIRGRVYETFMVLLMLSILVFGLVWVFSALLDDTDSSRETLQRVSTSYVPYLYSCMALLGVLMLLISTPLGFTRLFSVIGKLVVKPQFMENIDEEFHTAKFEEEDILRKIEVDQDLANGHLSQLRERLSDVTHERKILERRRRASSFQRIVGYPLVWILLFLLTVLSLCMVGWNIVRLLFGIGALPVNITEAGLGKVSLSKFGALGALLEVCLIFYLMLASMVGLYGISVFKTLVPKRRDTPMTKLIANCLVVLILSSALPVLSKMLGITNFDLLGEYGRLNSLHNFYMVLAYNATFGVATSSCLVNKFTASVRNYIVNNVRVYVHKMRRTTKLRPAWKAVNVVATANGTATGSKND